MKRMIKCPACGFTQEDSANDCPRCGIVFAKFYARASTQIEPPAPPEEVAEKTGWYQSVRPVFRAARWLTVAASVMLLYLILRPAPPLVVHMIPGAEQKAEAKIAQFERFVRAGKARILTLNEAELNSWLHSSLVFDSETDARTGPPAKDSTVVSAGLQADPTQPVSAAEEVRASVRDVRVGLLDDRVRTYVRFQLYGKDMSFELEGRVGATDGYLRLEPVSGKLGSCPLPASTLHAAVDRLFQSPENREKLRLPDYVNNLAVANGELQVEYAGR
ncbi:MAG: hypothetical protein WAO20_20095 [Acidobacteriota bacterium]